MKRAFIAASLVLSLSASARAQSAQTTTTTTTAATPAAAGTHIATPGRQALARAGTAYAAHQWDAALTAFREAQGSEAERVEATLGIGYVQASQGANDAALTTFRLAVTQTSAQSAQPIERVRALQAVATQLEAMTQWANAIAAWQEFVNYAEAHPTVANAAHGRARLQAIRARDDRERTESQVRTRIAERRARNATSPATPAGAVRQ